jgi:hypothetical protein
MRRMAAIRGIESGPSSEGNKESVAAAPSAPSEGRIGDVSAPVKSPPDRNKGENGFEGTPPLAKESLQGDGWTRAREKARKMAPAR